MKTFLKEKLCFKADNSLIKMCPRWTLLQDRHTSSKVVTLTKVNTSWCIKRLQIVLCINNVIFLDLSVSFKKKKLFFLCRPPIIKIQDKVMIPQDNHPEVNFIGLLIGPR